MSAALLARLLERIEREGPITFADFMEAALYDPDHGFYAGTPVGADGAFVTSPHVSAAFGVLLAGQLVKMWETLGRPKPFRIVEAGAGDGTLARTILDAAARMPGAREALEYVAVERGAASRKALGRAGIEALERIEDVPAGSASCVVANELLDNLPFHRIRNRGGTLVEVKVGAAGGSLVEIEDIPAAEALGSMHVLPPPGEERVASPAVAAFIRDVARVLDRGYALLFDYGAAGDPVRGYQNQRILTDVLTDPGSRDVTAGVDFDALVAAARASGLQAWGPVSQQEAMRALGLAEVVEEMRRAGVDAEGRGDARAALRLASERGKAALLADPHHVGGHLVLALGTPGLEPPAIVRG